ncbi:hypothetical protein SO802_008253 [Lithocarpus litseifolius]|uniref:Uncharacterized protein n=1 Tax=Lithocarpus litseifolius TaxID=425828 RepID=A0AAW2DC83_9ROSI
MEPLYSSDDENRPSVTESIQIQNSELDPQCKAAQRKLQRSVVKLFKENRGGNRADPPLKTCSGKFNTPSRPDTPTVSTIGTTIASRFRRSTTNMSATGTAAAKLLQSSGLSLSISAQPSNSLSRFRSKTRFSSLSCFFFPGDCGRNNFSGCCCSCRYWCC